MINEEAIVQILSVNRIGEIIHFQVQLPTDTKRIIGLEYGVTGQNGVPLADPEPPPVAEGQPSFRLYANKVIGKISLQNPGSENVFYQGNLIEDRNAELHEGTASTLWQPASWTHSRKREEVSLNVEGNTSFIEGFFQDSWGTNEYESLAYKLHLYLWIEKCKA
jgi:hypothetical protein